MTPIVKPTALKKGDAIGIVAPAGSVNRERIDRALARITARGFRTKIYEDIYRSRGYLAGDDETRANELMAAFADPETTAVWCARGGYGVMRLLDRIDFDVIRRNPKVFIGFSDITALHIAIGQRTGLITFHGPNVQDGFGKPDDMPAPNEAALWRTILNAHQTAAEAGFSYDIASVEGAALRPIRSGTATGPLTGGNLAVLCGMLGTPFEIETAGHILFLEDVSERPYRIDRYLMQLRLAGKLHDVAGVLLGDFSYDEADPAAYAADVSALLDEFFAQLNVPVLAGFPAGHNPINLALAIGGQFQLDADNQQVTLLETCVQNSQA
jgi:muramoyltetrapeptide carboxypeptidase